MVITKVSNTLLNVRLTGTATSSQGSSDVSNLGISFNDGAFNDGDASAVNNSTKSDLQVNFRDQLNIASSGGDYTTIAEAISNASTGDILNISSETYTEAGLTINKDLIIQGQGASSTIVQAHATQGSATDRVMAVNSGLRVTIQNLTIRNGKISSSMVHGAGIYSQADELTIVNSVICNNTINASYSKGGGISTAFMISVFCFYRF